MNKKDPFKTDKPLYDYSIEYDISHLPIRLQEIIKQLEYKSKFKGKQFYQIDTYYPSSQVCSVCGIKDKKYKNLLERKYVCNNCHNELDRDYNASVNIMFEGLKLFMNKEYILV